MHQLDDTFKQAKAKRAKRKQRNIVRRVTLGASLLLVVGAGTFLALNPGLWQGFFGGAGYEPVAVPGEELGAPAVYIPAIVDLAGDPMKISLGSDIGSEVTKFLHRPEAVPEERAQGDVALLSDVMITTSQRFMTTLPSSPKDFAFYQSQRVTVQQASYAPVEEVPEAALTPPPGETTIVDDGSGRGDSGDGNDAAAGVERAVIEDMTSIALVRPETGRFQPEGEFVGRVLIDRSLESLMQENRYSPTDAAVFAEALLRLLERDKLMAGDVVAIRGVRESTDSLYLRPVQLSLYQGGAYVGTLSRSDAGTVVLGADPWVYDNLFNYKGDQEVAEPGRQYRLLDAIYSTAVRNRVPTGVLGEAIMLLSRSFDLSAFASADDRLMIAYARGGLGDATGGGRILYVSVKGTGRDIECYVFKMPTDGDYSCFTATTRGQSMAMPGGMVAPVRGSLITPFGPAIDPVTKQKFTSAGIDWAAPVGTPVVAAFAGTVDSAGDGAIRIAHGGGRETTYGNLDSLAPGIGKGTKVAAGDLIGYVGAGGENGVSHLHFELIVSGAAVNPLQNDQTNTSDDEAVAKLVDQIVRVESGGNATAQNPLSSAYGLGQFIKTTWIRMMHAYRPDLANSMPEDQLLALRADPTLAREMVANLAHEGESYLKARGHAITAGTLYLCHFLGMEGAAIVLGAPPETIVDTLLPASALSANPTILPGRSASQVVAWSEGVMNHRRGGPSVPVAPPVPPEFKIYQAVIDEMLTPAPALEETLPGEEPAAPPPTTAALAVPGQSLGV